MRGVKEDSDHSNYSAAKAQPQYWQTNPLTWSVYFPMPMSMMTAFVFVCILLLVPGERPNIHIQ